MRLFFSSPAFTIPDCAAGPVNRWAFFPAIIGVTERAEIGLACTPTPCEEGDREGKKKEISVESTKLKRMVVVARTNARRPGRNFSEFYQPHAVTHIHAYNCIRRCTGVGFAVGLLVLFSSGLSVSPAGTTNDLYLTRESLFSRPSCCPTSLASRLMPWLIF